MTEIALDPAVSEGQTSEGPESRSAAPINEMGLGMLDLDQPQSDPDDQDAGQTDADEVEQAAPSASERTKTNDDLSPLERDRREADRYFTQQRQDFESWKQREMESIEQLKKAAQAPQAPTVQEQSQGDAESLRRAAMQATDPEQQRQLMEQAAGIEYVQQLAMQTFQQEAQKLGLDGIGQLRETLQQLQQNSQQQYEQAMQKQIAEAVEVFGDNVSSDPETLEFLRNNKGFLNRINPATGERYTLTDLLSRWTGRAANEAQEARQTQRTQRQQAKVGAATRGQSAGVRAPATGVISKDAALAEIRQTFE